MDIKQLDGTQVKETAYRKRKDIRTRVAKIESRISNLENIVLRLDGIISQLIRRSQLNEKL